MANRIIDRRYLKRQLWMGDMALATVCIVSCEHADPVVLLTCSRGF
jgi:hypothetical protein